ncbi:MAG: hypothetical protein IK115_13730 [Lachnospiraceae bacterium]|nr:hypothetical protein [Lachnospiraceae bacterium]
MATLQVILNRLSDYNGKTLYFVFFLAAWFYLFFAEKEKEKRLLFVWLPLVLMGVFVCPLSAWVSIHFFLDEETYYRQLWLIPYGAVVCYAALHAFHGMKGKRLRIGLSCASLVLVFIHKIPFGHRMLYSRAENAYHIPGAMIELTDYLLDQRCVVEYEYPPRTAFPGELLEYNHQYSAAIISAYGRESLISRWGNGHDLLMAINGPQPVSMEELCAIAEEHVIDCFILNREVTQTTGNCADYGYAYAGAVGIYDVYMLPWMAWSEEHPR